MYTFPVPDHMSSEDCATIAIVYLTAYYSLFDKAGLVSGQSVLVHAGAGGVGMATIHLCQKRGIKVYTTCSDSKRQALKDRFGLKDEQIGPSRSAAFKPWLMEQTGGRGVDCVLNSLAGDLLLASVDCVASGGSFCEIGKYDIQQRSKVGMDLLERNINFVVIDLLPLLKDKRFHPRWDRHLRTGFEKGEIVPLPRVVFDASEATEALRFVSQGKNVGKVLIAFPENFAPRIEPKFFTHGRHLITGGLGGMALELAKRLSERGCEELILVGRSGVTTGWQRRQLSTINCKVTIVKSSIANLPAQGELETIWHTATAYEDTFFSNMNEKKWDAVIGTKIGGFKHLRELYPETKVVCFTSVVGLHGNAGQTNYSFANEGLELIGKNSNTLCVAWGAVDNVGKAAEMGDAASLSKYRLECVSRLLDFFDETYMLTGTYARYALNEKLGGDDDADGPISLDDVKAYLAVVLGGTAEGYEDDASMQSFGLDSLSKMEIMGWVNRKTSKQITPDFLDSTTPKKLADHIAEFPKKLAAVVETPALKEPLKSSNDLLKGMKRDASGQWPEIEEKPASLKKNTLGSLSEAGETAVGA
jgi:NAD(P)-dependent dehydrogenase (short-subunit alcohol dehydrogenase family)